MGNVMWWSVVLIGLLVAAFIAVAQIKKRMISSEDFSGGGFTLGDLRALHRAGKMSDEEFEKAKQAILDAMKRAAERQAEAKAKRQSAPGGRGPGTP
jgi:uncharacterized membrane protein